MMDSAPDDIFDQLGVLIDVAEKQQRIAEKQQTMVDSASASLHAERERLARTRADLEALPDKLASATKAGAVEAVLAATHGAGQSLEQLRVSAEQTDAALAGSVADFRKAWTGALIVGGGIVCLVLVAFAVGFGLWERHEINRLTKQKDALEADVLSLRSAEQDFERRGRRIIWNRCGNYLCFVVKNKDRDWVEPNGERLAIPATIQDH